jgi:hypothetical protein
MKTHRGLSKKTILWSACAGGILLFALTAQAQTATPPGTTVSTKTIQVSGSANSVRTGLPEFVDFSGPLIITTTVVTDPLLPPESVVQIDGRGVKGIGRKTGTVYNNELEASLTRVFGPTDTVNTTFAFFQDATPGTDANAAAIVASKTGLLTLNLTYDTTTNTLTGATATLGTP